MQLRPSEASFQMVIHWIHRNSPFMDWVPSDHPQTVAAGNNTEHGQCTHPPPPLQSTPRSPASLVQIQRDPERGAEAAEAEMLAGGDGHSVMGNLSPFLGQWTVLALPLPRRVSSFPSLCSPPAPQSQDRSPMLFHPSSTPNHTMPAR